MAATTLKKTLQRVYPARDAGNAKFALVIAHVLLSTIAICPAFSSADARSAGVYHEAFDDWSFIDRDYSATFGEPPLSQRGLKLVPGRFGRALLNDNAFVEADFDQTYLSARDLDVLLEVLCHHRFKYYAKGLNVGGMQPYFWGTGRLKTDSGTVAFWAKGRRVHPGYLFFQGSSSFGRLEKDLLAIRLNEDRSLEAFIVDARYQRHAVKSSGLWKDEEFNHVAMAWDRSQGVVLYLNGRRIASNWGSDAWWTAQMPGLFHMPMCGFIHDELWMFDRPLTDGEIGLLYVENRPPAENAEVDSVDRAAAGRLRRAFIGSDPATLPVVRPSKDDWLEFKEVFPVWAGDGCVGAPCLTDGRYEMAWPMGYTAFTNILGDSDFQPEKIDIHLPSGSPVNYVTLEGNLAGVRLRSPPAAADQDSGVPARLDGDREQGEGELFSVPDDGRFHHGQMIAPTRLNAVRIPLVKGYGSPPGYKEGLCLPMTGDTRIHEVGFFHVQELHATREVGSRLSLRITGEATASSDDRYGYAFRALNDHRSSRVLGLVERPEGNADWVGAGAFGRLNLISEPVREATVLKAVQLNLGLRHVVDDEIVAIRIHDPGVPVRIWTSVVFRLNGFGRPGDRLRLRLDMVDIKVAAGDRLWIDVAFGAGTEVEVGGKATSTVLIENGCLAEGDGIYARKALQPARASFTKIYPWYYPWLLTGHKPSAERPVTFGGYHDIVTYPLAVMRTEPDDFLSNVLADLALIRRDVKPSYAPECWEHSPQFWPAIRTSRTDDSPDWAFHMNYYLTRYRDIVHWWADRQNPDGQVGGGWNDDVLFASRLPGPFLYTGDKKARGIFDRIFEGLEATRMFHDGYCNIEPMDSIHVEDFVRHRYEGLIFDPGDARKMKIAMRTAWHWGRPDKTPVNYGDGRCFKYDYDLIQWYWGRTPEYPVWSVAREQVTTRAKVLAPAMNDVLRFRYTEAGMYTDASAMPGSTEFKEFLVGGTCGPFLDKLSVAASWEEGGDPSIARWIEYASDKALTAHLYSYSPCEHDVTLRLYRLRKGIYRVTLAYEGKDAAKGVILARTQELRRFARVTFPVRPGRELLLRIDLERPLPNLGPLPDLAVGEIKQTGGGLQVEVLNLGSKSAGAFLVCLQDRFDRPLKTQTVPGMKSAEDFVPGIGHVEFRLTSAVSTEYHVRVDPDDVVEEISEENNSATVWARGGPG